MFMATMSAQPGPQADFLRSPADICIYGGAAGGGKTVGLILEPLRYVSRVPGFTAAFFRRTTPQITNPGVFGGLFGLPVINQPNVAILGLGTIEKRPVVVDDAIAIRSMVYLTLSYDHRVVDGAVAHQFMAKLKHTLENWSESIL